MNNLITEWEFKKLNKYPNRLICNDGSIYNRRGKRLSLKPSRGGYLRCRMYNSTKEHYTWVHRMVCYAFVGDCFQCDVHHKDKNIKNNHWWNFKILTEKKHYEEHKLANSQKEDTSMEQEDQMEQAIATI